MQQRRIALVLVAVLVAACGGDSTGPNATLSGTVSFTYTGAGGGTYNVSGVMPTIAANVGNSDWSAGFRDTPNTMTEIGSARARGGGRYDLALVALHRLDVGTSSVDANCDPETTNCSGMAFIVNISEADDNFDFICSLSTGSLAVTSITSGRVQGTFTGSGFCLNSSLSTSAFTVTSGTFDVPLVSNLPI